MKNKERVERLQKGLNFLDKEALDYWIEQGCQQDEDGIYTHGLTWTNEGYRLETHEDREEQRLKREAHRQMIQDMKDGKIKADPLALLLDAAMSSYYQHMSDNIFTSKPLWFDIKKKA